jgi:PIN domain nuclease of toxin-antitoxin system
MTVILDTHAFIWWDDDPSRLGPAARAECMNPGNQLILSVASIWEIQIKQALGKITLKKPLRQIIADQIQRNRIEILPIKLEHALRLESLPSHHKDPFDRMLVSQAIEENCRIISHDPLITKYNLNAIW